MASSRRVGFGSSLPKIQEDGHNGYIPYQIETRGYVQPQFAHFPRHVQNNPSVLFVDLG
jgi:hypothetical protein